MELCLCLCARPGANRLRGKLALGLGFRGPRRRCHGRHHVDKSRHSHKFHAGPIRNGVGKRV